MSATKLWTSWKPLLAKLRDIDGLRERKRGIFYRGATAFLHFHEDPSGLYADLKVNGEWRRMPAETASHRSKILKAAGNAAW